MKSPILSICITSYNRVDELYRCLKSIDIIKIDSIEIIVSEDCSPKKKAITNIVEKFISNTRYPVVYNSNDKNLGFDKNLGKLIDLSRGKYMLFVTDDDAFIEGALDKVLSFIIENDFGVAFTPYIDQNTGIIERKMSRTHMIKCGLSGVKSNLFNSILLSGLIFNKSKIDNYQPEHFKDMIYSQVYLFCNLLLKNDGYYIDIPLINCIGDGENSFGLNNSSARNEMLANRKSPLSNLEYHKSLIKIIKKFDIENSENLIDAFSKEYSIRSYTGMKIARIDSIDTLKNYRKIMRRLDIKIHPISEVYYYMLMFLGVAISNFITSIPRHLLLLTRKRGG